MTVGAEGSGRPGPSIARPSLEGSGDEDAQEAVSAALRAVSDEIEAAMGSPERVQAACSDLRRALEDHPAGWRTDHLVRLARVLRHSSGPMALPVFTLLEEQAPVCRSPMTVLAEMMTARDRDLAGRALSLAAALAETGPGGLDVGAARSIADCLEGAADALATPAALGDASRLLRRTGAATDRSGQDAAMVLCLEEPDGPLRRLAARVLDLEGAPASREVATRLLGPDAVAVLAPYLDYSRATHVDLLALAAARGATPPIAAAIRNAESICGPALLKEVIAVLGWESVRLGLDVRDVVGVTADGSLPMLASPAEARILESCPGGRRAFRRLLIVAHGGPPGEDAGAPGSRDTVARFRACNLEQALMLSEILDMSPLTGDRVRRLVDRMDRIVGDFLALFSAHSGECAILPGVWAEIRGKILCEMGREGGRSHLSAELSRLVLSFEDPATPGEIRTLHGLKRYLHQRGLRLAFRLAEAGRATNRTVDLAIAENGRLIGTFRRIRYLDFEPGSAGEIPYPVALISEAFARQAILGKPGLPGVRVFLYGNEVHFYVSFGNHPAFLRIDFAPPLLGGMIDLEFYGVSKYELAQHPDPSLDAIRRFFRALEFDVDVENTRIHARYDKERALDLGDLCRKAAQVLCLVPHIMEIDWAIGDLAIDDGARAKAAQAWAERFAAWSVLPLEDMLTKDRRGILSAMEEGPHEAREIVWDGAGDYRDRYSAPVPPAFLEAFRTAMEELGLNPSPRRAPEARRPPARAGIEQELLSDLREAVRRGEVLEAAERIVPAPDHLFQREDDTVRFAEILASSDHDVAAAAATAATLAPVERSLRFRTSGSVNGYEVQCARLALKGEEAGVSVLRDEIGIMRLAIFYRGGILCRRRAGASSPWSSTGSHDAPALAALLRRNGIPPPGSGAPSLLAEEGLRIRRIFLRPAGSPGSPPPHGDRLVVGLKAAPGRAMGPAAFGTGGRRPTDLRGAILIAPCLRPEDNTFLYNASGVVSTGGGILSHAGLIATQFRKPALIIDGAWHRDRDGSLSLRCTTVEYTEEKRLVKRWPVITRRDLREPAHTLREGDLVVLDATEGTLLVLGRDPQALALHEGLRAYAEAGRRLPRSADDRDVLALRGRLLRARHQVERALRAIADASLARHAVREVLLGDAVPEGTAGSAERARLLSILLANPRVAATCREHAGWLATRLGRDLEASARRIIGRAPLSESLHEMLALRLGTLRLRESVAEVRSIVSNFTPRMSGAIPGAPDIDAIVMQGIRRLRASREAALRAIASAGRFSGRLRHLARQVGRLDQVIGAPVEKEAVALRSKAAEMCRRADRAAQRRTLRSLVATSRDAGFEIHAIIGWKAANLAEVGRIAGGHRVPPWFVITDRAFRSQLAAPAAGPNASGGTIGEAIDAILGRGDLEDDRKAILIRSLWEDQRLPGVLVDQILAAYRGIFEEDGPPGPVAVRSSASEEDAEAAARAGEFETFLFVRGEGELIDHVKLAWSGLWTERAIHNRALMAWGGPHVGGGVIVQRMLESRVSGVLQTVNLAEGNFSEMVINAGLGLGEGIVSGVVAADHVVVSKEDGPGLGPLKFRYVTADKQEQVVFDRRTGQGTTRSETLYHQRLRPALEYVELRELVGIAADLERAYGYPLDIEFGIEGRRLWILQARPVAAFLPVLRETCEHSPLAGPARDPASRETVEARS